MAKLASQPDRVLSTERLVLRPPSLDHLADLHRLHSDPFVAASIFDGRCPTLAQTRITLRAYVARWRRYGFGYWMVYTKPAAMARPTFIGRTGLKPLERTDDVELAHCYFLTSSGQGYAVEAARAALAFGFRCAGLGRIVCVVRPTNTRSLRVTEKLGFRYAGDRWHLGKTMRFFVLEQRLFLSPGGRPPEPGRPSTKRP